MYNYGWLVSKENRRIFQNALVATFCIHTNITDID